MAPALNEANINLAHAGRALLDVMLATSEEQQAAALARSDRYLALTCRSLEAARPRCRDEQAIAALARIEASWQDYRNAVTTLRANAAGVGPDERGDVVKYLYANFARVVGSTGGPSYGWAVD